MSHRAVAVVKISHGGAQKHLAYISRPEALRPAERTARNTVKGAHENERMENVHNIGIRSLQRNPNVKSPSSNSCTEVVPRNEAADHPYDIADLLGHSVPDGETRSTRVTRGYAHGVPQRLRDAVNSLEKGKQAILAGLPSFCQQAS
jgi:hypothetical protein